VVPEPPVAIRNTDDVDRSQARAQRALIAVVQVLALAVWFSATAVAPSLRVEWDLGASAAVWLTASVQIGFALGALASSVLNLPDRIPPQRLLAGCALGAATCTALLAAGADGLAAAVPLRALTGMFLAGVYPVGMKLMASWSESVDRGRAFGVLIGCLTLGSALPHLISGVGPLPWRAVMLAAAGVALAGGVVALALVRPGALLAPTPVPQARYAFAVFGERRPRLANIGYFGHMWELYAFWSWVPAFVAVSRTGESGDTRVDATVSLTAFVVIGLAGFAGSVAGGWASDRYGRSAAAMGALGVSGACCLLAPVFFVAPWWLLVTFLCVWGAAVIADSGVFSTALSETADQRFVGTALTIQTAVGFLLTVVTIQLVPLLADQVGWRYAFWLLAPGPAIGVVAMWRFGRPAAGRQPK
jgi:MFS family permease